MQTPVETFIRTLIVRCALLAATAASSLAPAATPATRPTTGPADLGQEGAFFHVTNYGHRLPAQGERVDLWWCDATRKVPRDRVLPKREGAAVHIAAARNEFEAAQVVIRPRTSVTGLTATVSDFVGPNDARLPASAIRLLRVAYVPVTVPTDARGAVGDWPDPLPPLDAPLDLPAGVNQPLWLLVHVPPDASPGVYRGRIALRADDFTEKVPVRVRVWNFALPDRPSTASAFGLNVGWIARYHGLTSEQDRRAVFAKYMQSFADHRISPYNPVPFDPIRFDFKPDADPPRCDIDWSRFDAAMEEAVRKYHITSFQLQLPGLGGGTFHARREGELAGHKAGTPIYETMMASMLGQVEQHLADKGWLDLAYIYWFDEPKERDYAFVRAGMDRIHKYAPRLRRLLTLMVPADDTLHGGVDIWCPVSRHFDPALAAERIVAGETFWWYICTGPRQPYCTLFIDHPATCLRVWLWQTWQRDIRGILIWSANYWTSPTAFPDALQNPYGDAMAYRTGYGQEVGTKAYWGNGDGRFLYPPLAAVQHSTDPIVPERPDNAAPVLDGPVSSLRWEMLRDGIEDVDYLYLLRDTIEAADSKLDPALLAEARALLAVPASITTSLTEFTFDSRPIYQQRRKVAEMIERLNAAP